MKLVWFAVLAFVGGSSIYAAQRGGRDWLIIEFPDGVRGGRGKIQGIGKPTNLYSDANLLQQVRRCGAINPVIDQSWSHSVFVVSQSSRTNRAVIACLKRTSAKHFNAGIGSNLPEQYFDMDRRPFVKFLTPLNKAEKTK